MIPTTLLAIALFLPAADAKSTEVDDWFKQTGPLPVFKIDVDKENLALLKKDARKNVRANLRFGSETFPDMGVHEKGRAGSFRNWDDKPALTFNSNKFKKNQLFHGLDKFSLNNSVQDGTFMHEILTTDLCRACNVPAARGTQVVVELNGRKVGIYLMKEGFDKVYLSHNFADSSGNLYDGGFLTDIDQTLELGSGKGDDGKDLKALVKACEIKDPKERYAALDKKLDLEKFYYFWAIEVLGCDWDGYTRNRNNYRIYHDPKTDKFVFFCHGKDQMFVGVNDSLVPGFGGLVARRLFETEEGKKKYFAALNEVAAKHMTLEKMNKRIDELAPRVKDALNGLNKGSGDAYMKEQIRDLKERLKRRVEYVAKELPKLK